MELVVAFLGTASKFHYIPKRKVPITLTKKSSNNYIVFLRNELQLHLHPTKPKHGYMKLELTLKVQQRWWSSSIKTSKEF